MPDDAKPIDPDIVAGRIGALLQDRRSGAARPLLAALRKLAPEHKDLVPLQVSHCCQTGDFPQALRLLQVAVAAAPGNAALHLQRAEILFAQSDYAGAAADAAEAVLAPAASARAKAVLGLALLKLGQFDSALSCLRESFGADPGAVDVALALAMLLPENAVEILGRAIVATPSLSVLRNALTRRYLSLGDSAAASQVAGNTRRDGVADPETHCLLAFAHMQERRWDDAKGAIAQAQLLAPGNLWAARLAAALEQMPMGELRAPPQPDALAAEQAWIAGGTIVPGCFRGVLAQLQCTGPVLDLFCGTGLNAITARDICPGDWTGVEPDAGLLKLCGERSLYTRLEHWDPRAFLAGGAKFPVILLNEAFGTTASPMPWLTLLRAGLFPGGIALAAIPIGSPGLNGHGLFAHDIDGVAAQANQTGLGFSLIRSGILRHVEGIALHGVIARFQPL